MRSKRLLRSVVLRAKEWQSGKNPLPPGPMGRGSSTPSSAEAVFAVGEGIHHRSLGEE